MNRKRRKALKMLKRKYCRAVYPYWQRREIHGIWDLSEALATIYHHLVAGTTQLSPEQAKVLREGSWDLLD